MFDNVDTKGTFIFTYAIPLLTFTITPDVIYEDVKALLLTVNLLDTFAFKVQAGDTIRVYSPAVTTGDNRGAIFIAGIVT